MCANHALGLAFHMEDQAPVAERARRTIAMWLPDLVPIGERRGRGRPKHAQPSVAFLADLVWAYHEGAQTQEALAGRLAAHGIQSADGLVRRLQGYGYTWGDVPQTLERAIESWLLSAEGTYTILQQWRAFRRKYGLPPTLVTELTERLERDLRLVE
jgi:hypothetical protein